MADSVIAEPVVEQSSQQATNPRDRIYPVTIALIVINALVFLAMAVSARSFSQPTPLQALTWGADYGPLTIAQHQWWRMLTACFVHFGIIHIAFNMFVLFHIGSFVEWVFGRARYLAIYIFAGLSGNFVSLWIHPSVVSAGASGAIFGLYGAVLGFLAIERHSLAPAAVKRIGRSAGIFILYNMIYGARSGTTDLSAHLGGLVGGFLIGMMLVRSKSAANQMTT